MQRWHVYFTLPLGGKWKEMGAACGIYAPPVQNKKRWGQRVVFTLPCSKWKETKGWCECHMLPPFETERNGGDVWHSHHPYWKWKRNGGSMWHSRALFEYKFPPNNRGENNRAWMRWYVVVTLGFGTKKGKEGARTAPPSPPISPASLFPPSLAFSLPVLSFSLSSHWFQCSHPLRRGGAAVVTWQRRLGLMMWHLGVVDSSEVAVGAWQQWNGSNMLFGVVNGGNMVVGGHWQQWCGVRSWKWQVAAAVTWHMQLVVVVTKWLVSTRMPSLVGLAHLGTWEGDSGDSDDSWVVE